MSYPKSVYHKSVDFKNLDEAVLKKHSKVVHSDKQLDLLGPDWIDHPEHVDHEAPKKAVVEEVESEDKPKRGRK